jgi:NAD-dependent DNA ligase
MTIIELDSSVLRSTVAFTGRLACMSRAKAFDMVRQHGGTPSQAVRSLMMELIVHGSIHERDRLTHHKHRYRVSARDRIAAQQR